MERKKRTLPGFMSQDDDAASQRQIEKNKEVAKRKRDAKLEKKQSMSDNFGSNEGSSSSSNEKKPKKQKSENQPSKNNFKVELSAISHPKCHDHVCKSVIPRGCLAIAKISPNPFQPDEPQLSWYHAACCFRAMTRAKKGTKKIESAKDIGGFDNLASDDKGYIERLVEGDPLWEKDETDEQKHDNTSSSNPTSLSVSSSSSSKPEPNTNTESDSTTSNPKAKKPKAKKPKAKKKTNACPHCTFENKFRATTCEMCETVIKPPKKKKKAGKRKKKNLGPNLEMDDSSENSAREDFEGYYDDDDYDPMKDRSGSTMSRNESDDWDAQSEGGLAPIVEEDEDDLGDILRQSRPRKRKKIICKYHPNCYRKNEMHFKQYAHPGRKPP